MKDKNTIKIYLYTRYERLWHWLQGLMIIILVVTGLEIHGTYKLIGFQTAVNIHNFVGLSWLILFAFLYSGCLPQGNGSSIFPQRKNSFQQFFFIHGEFFKAIPTRFKNRKVPNTIRCNGWHTWVFQLCCCRFRWLQGYYIICIMIYRKFCPCQSQPSYTH